MCKRSNVELKREKTRTLNDDGTKQMDRNLPPGLSVIDFLEEQTPKVQGLENRVQMNKFDYPMKKNKLGKNRSYEESDETEVGANGDPERSKRVIDEGHGQVDDGGTEREDTDSPQVDGEMRKTVETLDVSDTLRNTTTRSAYETTGNE